MLQGRCGLAVGEAETATPTAKVRGPASEADHEKVRIIRVLRITPRHHPRIIARKTAKHERLLRVESGLTKKKRQRRDREKTEGAVKRRKPTRCTRNESEGGGRRKERETLRKTPYTLAYTFSQSNVACFRRCCFFFLFFNQHLAPLSVNFKRGKTREPRETDLLRRRRFYRTQVRDRCSRENGIEKRLTDGRDARSHGN